MISRDTRLYYLNLDGEIISEVKFPGYCNRMTWDGESLWCTDGGKKIYQANPASGQTLKELEVDMSNIQGMTWDGDAMWIIDRSGNLARYDRSGQRLRRLAVPVDIVTGLVWVKEELWVADSWGRMTRFDNKFAAVGSLTLTQECATGDSVLYWDGTSLWIANPKMNRVSQCKPPD